MSRPGSQWKSRSAPLLHSSQGLRRPTGLLSTAGVELSGDSRAGTPATRGSQRSRGSSRQANRSSQFVDHGFDRPASRPSSWPKRAQATSSLGLPALSTPKRSYEIDMFDRRMAQKFTETPVAQQMAEELQHPSSPSRPGTATLIRPSREALLENYKKEQYHRHIEHGFKHVNTGKEEVFADLDSEKTKLLSEEFLREVSAFERQVQDCSFRLHGASKNPKEDKAAKEAAERAAQKEWEAEEQRKLRKKEQMARDPHRKIQLRLENKRRFGMETLDKVGIPMQKICTTVGGKSPSSINLVDVTHLQRKCKGLGEPGGIRMMLELQETVEKSQFLQESVEKERRESKQNPMSATCESSQSTLTGTWEDRLLGIRDQSERRYEDTMQRKLQAMRQPTPTRFPHQVFSKREATTEMELIMASSQDGVQLPSRLTAQLSVASAWGTHARKGRIVTGAAHGWTVEADGHQVAPRIAEEHTFRIPPSSSPRVVAAAKKGWVQVRGVVRFLKMYFRHMRQLDSAPVVKCFLRQMGEWARVKHAMRKLRTNITLFQRLWRSFYELREQRTGRMIRDWIRIESTYLHSFYRVYYEKCQEEHHQQIEEEWAKSHPSAALNLEKSRAHKGLAEETSHLMTGDLVDKVVSVEQYCIPACDRKAVVTRFYMINLVRRQKSREAVRKTVMEALRWQRELISYLQSYGAEHVSLDVPEEVDVDRAAVDRSASKVQMMDFWYFPKEVILDTICMCAKALKRVEPFDQHPANRSQVLPDKRFDEFARVPRQLSKDIRLALQAEIKQSAVSVSRSVRRRSLMERPMSLNDKDDEDAVEQDNAVIKVKSFDDLDDLWATPRLMETFAAAHTTKPTKKGGVNDEEENGVEDSTLSPGMQIFRASPADD